MIKSRFLIILSLLFALLMLFSCSNTATNGADSQTVQENVKDTAETQPAEPANPYAPTVGATFTGHANYQLVSTLEQMPRTFEAWVKINGKTGKSNIFGNMYEEGTNAFSFRVRDGIPTLFLAARSESVAFNKAKVTKDEWTHVTITADVEAKKFHCYVNGELKESKSMIGGHITAIDNIEFNSETKTHMIMLGGIFSYSDDSKDTFCGELGSFAAYSDVRSAEEIAKDYQSFSDPDRDGLMVAYVLDESGKTVYRDLSRNSNNFTIGGHGYLTSEDIQIPADYDYSVVVVGDTQGLSARSDTSGYYGLYDWIAANIEAKKIEAVIGVGDITNNNTDVQWERAVVAFEKLKGKVDHFPVIGNHDVSVEYGGDDPVLYDHYFPFEHNENNGSFDGTMKSYFYRFEMQGEKFLFLGMGYSPKQEDVDWAKTVLDAHPDYNVILSCHGYLDADGSPLKHSGAPILREQLVLEYSNIVLVLCGHMHNDNVLLYTEERKDGTTVQALLTNPQEYNYDVNVGIATVLYFARGGETVYVANHLVGYDAYLGTESVRSFELDLVHNRK